MKSTGASPSGGAGGGIMDVEVSNGERIGRVTGELASFLGMGGAMLLHQGLNNLGLVTLNTAAVKEGVTVGSTTAASATANSTELVNPFEAIARGLNRCRSFHTQLNSPESAFTQTIAQSLVDLGVGNKEGQGESESADADRKYRHGKKHGHWNFHSAPSPSHQLSEAEAETETESGAESGVSNHSQITETVADHVFCFLPSFGFGILLCGIVISTLRKAYEAIATLVLHMQIDDHGDAGAAGAGAGAVLEYKQSIKYKVFRDKAFWQLYLHNSLWPWWDSQPSVIECMCAVVAGMVSIF